MKLASKPFPNLSVNFSTDLWALLIWAKELSSFKVSNNAKHSLIASMAPVASSTLVKKLECWEAL